MKKKKEIPENAGPLNWEELPEGEQVEEETLPVPTAERVRAEVLRHTAAAVMCQYTVNAWNETRALKWMPKLTAGVTAAVKAVCPGKQFTDEDVKKAVLDAVKMRNHEAEFADTVRNKWNGNGIALADSIAYVLNFFRERLPDVYQDNPVIGWSIRNDGCTFIFRDGQKKVIEL